MLQRITTGMLVACVLIGEFTGAAESPAQKAEELVKTLSGPEAGRIRDARVGQWWRDAKFGLFIHWGPASLSGAEISWGMKNRIEGGELHQRVDHDVYINLYRQFNPVEFDADEWMRLAKDAGMQYVVFVTKHHDGFSMWPTAQVRFPERAGFPEHYSIQDTPYRQDICRMIADAAHKHGLKLGWYYSTRDWTHPDYLQGDNKTYNDYYQAQVRELLTQYGQVDIMWFDHCFGAWSQYTHVDLFKMMYGLQGNLLVNNRAAAGLGDVPSDGSNLLVAGDYDTPEQRIGAFQYGRAWESCVTMTHCDDGGGWSYRPDGRTRSLDECIQMLVGTVTGDGNLLLNIGPTPTGRFQPQEIANLKGMGRWLREFGESVYGTRGGPYRNGAWGGSCHKDRTLYLHVFQWPGDTLRLPPLKARVLRADVLTGGAVKMEQTSQALSLVLPASEQNKTDTVIRLELDSPAANEFLDGKPLDVPAM
jgi:alpha-L-fucosidase